MMSETGYDAGWLSVNQDHQEIFVHTAITSFERD